MVARPRMKPRPPPSAWIMPWVGPPPSSETMFMAPPTAEVPYREEPEPRRTSTCLAFTKVMLATKELASPWVVVGSRKRIPSIKTAEASGRRPRMRIWVRAPGPPSCRICTPGTDRTISARLFSLRLLISSAETTLIALVVWSMVWAPSLAVTITVWARPPMASLKSSSLGVPVFSIVIWREAGLKASDSTSRM